MQVASKETFSQRKLTGIDNTCIYEEMTTLWELQPTPHIYPLTPALLPYVNKSPRYLQLSFVCMSLVHRINRTRNDSRPYALFETVHQYWGDVIRALREDINIEHRRTSDFMIAGIITCLLSDVSWSLSKEQLPFVILNYFPP